MIFRPTPLGGAYVLELEPHADQRGFFARSFCRKELAEHGIDFSIAQCNISHNARRGTLRGMHFQAAPAAEAKLVRCTAGAIWDVIVDLRADSPTHLRWFAEELSAGNRRTLYVPVGFAHGFESLTDDAEVLYLMSEFFSPEHARGARWDDPAFGIRWPMAPTAMSEKDRGYPHWNQSSAQANP